jgi:hypothetical protein
MKLIPPDVNNENVHKMKCERFLSGNFFGYSIDVEKHFLYWNGMNVLYSAILSNEHAKKF